jgi:hypothetical protein
LAQARDHFARGSKEYNRLNGVLNAYGEENSANGVVVGFGALSGTAAGHTTPSGEGEYQVTFDPSKMSGVDKLAIDAGHEGTHVADLDTIGSSPTTTMTGFNLEYRGYQTSSYVAQGLGMGTLTYTGGAELWNPSWKAADIQTLRDKGATNVVLGTYKDADYQETKPHDPWPKY